VNRYRIPRRHRWLLIVSYPGDPTIPLDPDESVEEGAFQRRTLQPRVDAYNVAAPHRRQPTLTARIMRRADWLKAQTP
jgi:hypothetical protein